MTTPLAEYHPTDEEFSIDIFSEQLRLSPPYSVQFFTLFYRWAICLSIPSILIALCWYATFYAVAVQTKYHLEIYHIAAVIFAGAVFPLIVWIIWIRSFSWRYLSCIDLAWRYIKKLAEENGHHFPDAFYRPFIQDEFQSEYAAFSGEPVIDSKTDIDGFVISGINLNWKEKSSVLLWNIVNTDIDKFQILGFYLESVYWKQELGGLRFYGERMNIFIPYRAIHEVKKGTLWCNIVIILNQEITGRWTDFTISVEHLGTKKDDRMLRDELLLRIQTAKMLDLMYQLTNLPGLTVEPSP